MKLTTFEPATSRVLMKPRSLVALAILGGIAAQAYGFQQYQIWALPEAPGDASRATALIEMGSGNDRIIIGGLFWQPFRRRSEKIVVSGLCAQGDQGDHVCAHPK